MNGRRLIPGVSARVLILAVLLLAQGLLLAHEFDHFGTTDSGLCAVCQAGNSLHTPAIASSPPPADATSAPAWFAPPLPECRDASARPHSARAPPLALSA